MGVLPLLSLSIPQNSNSTTNIELSVDVVLTITSDKNPIGENIYLVESQISFEFSDQGWTSAELQLKGQVEGEIYNVNLDKLGGIYSGTWVSKNPTGNGIPASADKYSIILTTNTGIQNTIPSEITLSTGESFPIWLIFVIIGAAAGVIVSSLFVVKKKKASKQEDLEFGKVDGSKGKKKGQVFKGASAIGKQSGKIAEAKTGKKEPKADSKADSGASIYTFKSDETPSSAPKREQTQMMPASPGFEFETRASTGAAIMKSMEMQLDLDSKVNFTISKIESLLQNIQFFKAILLQQDQKEPRCPNCDKKMTNYWPTCPYCEIRDHDSELGLKQSMLSISTDIKFCPNCKRIIKPNWITCPFCYVIKNN